MESRLPVSPMTTKLYPLVKASAKFSFYKKFLDIHSKLKMAKTSLNLFQQG